jgi:hypothetical protein
MPADDAIDNFGFLADYRSIHHGCVLDGHVFADSGEVINAGVDDCCSVFYLAVSSDKHSAFDVNFPLFNFLDDFLSSYF